MSDSEQNDMRLRGEGDMMIDSLIASGQFEPENQPQVSDANIHFVCMNECTFSTVEKAVASLSFLVARVLWWSNSKTGPSWRC